MACDEFWRQSIARGPDEKIMDAIHEVPGWVNTSPTAMMLLGLAHGLAVYMCEARNCRASSRPASRCCTASCSTNGISTNLYDADLRAARARALATRLVEARRRAR
jgi:hypothetical protein